jgi:Survival motor neuron (SMN) interacting protein 1 (SIP1)
MVSRSEANNIPQLLVAPKQNKTETEPNFATDDSRGYYEDGAYIAAPVMGPILPKANGTSLNEEDQSDLVLDLTPREAFTNRLLRLYHSQRELLHGTKPERQSQTGPGALRHLLLNNLPDPTKLSRLSQKDVLTMLQHGTYALKRKRNIDSRLSAWLWGLLCKLGHVGTLDSDAVSTVRELGKKAVWVGIDFFNEEAGQITNDYDGAEEKDRSEEDHSELETELPEEPVRQGCTLNNESLPEKTAESPARSGARQNTSSPIPSEAPVGPIKDTVDHEDALEAARVRLMTTLNSLPMEPTESAKIICPDTNTRATLDTIITIVGEVYGQRDLLEFRGVWGGENGLWG